MPAEIDTGRPRVLHSDSRADRPTTPFHRLRRHQRQRHRRHVPTCAGERRTRRSADNTLVVDQIRPSGLLLSAGLPRIDGRSASDHCSVRTVNDPSGSRGSEILCEIDERARTEIRAQPVDLDRDARHAELPKSRDDDEKHLSDQRGKNVLDPLTRPRRARRETDGLARRLVTRGSRIGDVAVEDADARLDVEIVRGESRPRAVAERSRRAIANASGREDAGRRSHRDRSRSARRGAASSRERDPVNRAARENSLLLSSHRPRVRVAGAREKENSAGGVAGGRIIPGDDARLICSRVRGVRSTRVEAASETTGRDLPRAPPRGAAKQRACNNVRAYLRLAFLALLVAFGRSGPAERSVFKFSAGLTASGLSALAISTVIGAVSAAPLGDPFSDAGIRAERSANLSHITGASRKIQMYIKHRHLQILPDGTVNGSNDDTSEYTIFQRTSVSRGQLRIQGLATCLYLCMDSCGLLYGSREYTEDCVFNETLEQHNYNTYSSVRWSTAKKTLYLGLNRRGQPRRVQAKGHNLGRLSAYARVLTQVAPADRVEALQRRMLGSQHNVRHRHHGHAHRRQHGDGAVAQQSMCPSLPPQEKDGRDRFRCRKRKKRKKRKRRCRPGERPGPQCQAPEEYVAGVVPVDAAMDADAPLPTGSSGIASTTPESKRSCEGAASEEACRRQALSVPAKKRKSRIDVDGVDHPAAAAVVFDGGGGNFTLNGKNKAPTSKSAKKPNVGGDSESKKPDLTDGKKRRRKGPTTQARTSGATSSQKRYALGTTSSPASSSPRTTLAGKKWAPTASSLLSSSGASIAASAGKPNPLGTPGRRKPSSPPPPSRNHVARPPLGSRRAGKSFSTVANTPDRPRWWTQPPASRTTPRSELTDSLSTTKVPETTTPPSPSSLSSPGIFSSMSWQESAEDLSTSLSDPSLVDDEEPSTSSVASEFATGSRIELDTSSTASSSEFVAEPTTFGLVDESDEETNDGTADDMPSRTITRFPIERLTM